MEAGEHVFGSSIQRSPSPHSLSDALGVSGEGTRLSWQNTAQVQEVPEAGQGDGGKV